MQVALKDDVDVVVTFGPLGGPRLWSPERVVRSTSKGRARQELWVEPRKSLASERLALLKVQSGQIGALNLDQIALP
jgi:hypothetical protein